MQRCVLLCRASSSYKSKDEHKVYCRDENGVGHCIINLENNLTMTTAGQVNTYDVMGGTDKDSLTFHVQPLCWEVKIMAGVFTALHFTTMSVGALLCRSEGERFHFSTQPDSVKSECASLSQCVGLLNNHKGNAALIPRSLSLCRAIRIAQCNWRCRCLIKHPQIASEPVVFYVIRAKTR